MLGIETSCDDTGVAIVTSEGEILGEALASQAALHEEWGGVVPGIARDAHAEALDRVVAQALERANMGSVDEVDAVGVTVGPGWRSACASGASAQRRSPPPTRSPLSACITSRRTS